MGASGSEPAETTLSRGESRDVFGYDSTPDFIAFDPQYRRKHAKYADELRELQLELARQTAKGRATPCSRQIFLEARWLVHYSAHWERIERRLQDLRELLSRPADPPDTRDQVEADGSFDRCSETWFLKLDSTIEEVEDLRERGLQPKSPLKILDRINGPEKLRAYLDSLLISDVRKTGLDNRFELNIAITAIERFIVVGFVSRRHASRRPCRAPHQGDGTHGHRVRQGPASFCRSPPRTPRVENRRSKFVGCDLVARMESAEAAPTAPPQASPAPLNAGQKH